MHISKLVLDNFKSFGRKTEIPFHDDFTTVSGPNGSGKSNIIDSVLFALGLARTRGIRAEKLTDLIYNPGHAGDDANGGPREANVTVTLDNSDGTLDRAQVVNAAGTDDIGDVETITIRRRVKRTEENYYSYYYLNGRSVNLSDIRDLLAQAGVKPEGYNVVMQGDVTGIINMTPLQRRTIIDEIAGVAEFDEKKEKATEELETVKERIAEAELRIEEKEERLEQLADEREEALAYQSLREEKATYEGYRKAAELEDRRDELEESTAELAAEREAHEESARDLTVQQRRVRRLQEDLEDLNLEIERKGEDEQLQIQREMETIKGEISRIQDRIEAAEERIEAAERTKRETFVELDRQQEAIEEHEAAIKETKLQKVSVKSDIEEKAAERDEIQAEIDSVDEAYEELRDDLEAAKRRLEDCRATKNDHQREQDRLLDEARRRTNRIAEIETEIDEAEDRLDELADERTDLEAELDRATENHDQIESVIEDLKTKRTVLRDELAAIEDSLEAAQNEYARLEAAREQNGDQSYSRAVTTVLNAEIDGVHGTVAQLGGVEDQYAQACETAAGARLANVVVDDERVGQRCIEFLKSRNAGRATFLPIAKMSTRSLPTPPDADGVIDFAVNLVDFDDQYAGIFSYVFGDTLVVDTLDTARSLMGRHRLVTLDGDLVEKSGAMTGGSGGGARYSFSKSGKGKLERIAERITDLQDERDEHRTELTAVEDRLEDARDRRSDAAETVRDIETEIERVERERGDVTDRLDRLADERESLESERESVDEEMQEIERKIGTVTDEIDAIRDEIAALEDALADSQIPELTAERDTIEDEIRQLEDHLDDLDSRHNELALQKEYAGKAAEQLEDDIETAKAQIRRKRREIDAHRRAIHRERERLAEKEAMVESLESELAELKRGRDRLRERVQTAVDRRDSIRTTVESHEHRIEELESTKARLESEIEELQAEVGDYDPDDIPAHTEVESNIDRLEAEMAALEPVNMLAIDDYDAVEAELEELVERKDVLDEERREIITRIESYEEQKRDTFMESYEAINGYFRDIFERLSNGTGTLHLENREDPFDGGLTMRAQPEDKPVQRLDAMSGGEKSLTALAFIFAIQRHNPAPFYALDEIDAFLDAANAERVGELVDELADTAQFIVVTHRSAMLERSERAIGVTMREDNVSAVTGIEIGSSKRKEVVADV